MQRPAAKTGHDLWALALLAIVGLTSPSQARERECYPLRDPLRRAMCSDAELRDLLKTGEHRITLLLMRLSPTPGRQLLANQRKWREAVVHDCGLGKSSARPLTPSVRNCLLEANRLRVAWLESYAANPKNGPPPTPQTATPTPPARATNPPSTTDTPPTVDRRQPAPPPEQNLVRTVSKASPLAWLFEIAAAVAAVGIGLEILMRVRRSRAIARKRRWHAENQQREIDLIRRYFDDVNRLRRLPECDVPMRLEPGEFGVAACPAQRWELQSHRGTAGGDRKPLPNSRTHALTYSYRQLDPVASGMLVVTNRQVVFQSESHSFHCAHDDLLTVHYDRTHLRLLGRRQPSPVIFSAERANFMKLLIDGLVRRRFPDGRLPAGKIVSVRPNERAGIVLAIAEAAPFSVAAAE